MGTGIGELGMKKLVWGWRWDTRKWFQNTRCYRRQQTSSRCRNLAPGELHETYLSSL